MKLRGVCWTCGAGVQSTPTSKLKVQTTYRKLKFQTFRFISIATETICSRAGARLGSRGCSGWCRVYAGGAGVCTETRGVSGLAGAEGEQRPKAELAGAASMADGKEQGAVSA